MRIWPLLFCFVTGIAVAQSEAYTAMQKLDFLAGSWAGPGHSFDEKGEASAYHDTEDVWYDAQGGVLVIQAKGFRDDQQFYGLHTVIYYDVQAGHYWYQPYTEKGARSYKCHLEAQVFRCINDDETFRLTFQRTPKGAWNEYGERLTEGQWRKTFETILLPAVRD